MITDSYKRCEFLFGSWVLLDLASEYWLLARASRGMHWYALGYTKAGKDHYE